MTVLAGCDVVVVGGGLVGSALAYELVSAGADTVLVDRHDPGRATDAGAGILSPETNRDPDPVFAEFGMTAARHYEGLTARLVEDGAGDVGFHVVGSLLVAERPGDDMFMEDAARLVEARCPGLAREIDPGEVHRFFPPLGPVRRALHNPAARRVDGRLLNTALRRGAERRGLRIVDAAATSLDLDAVGGTVRAVVTDEGTVPSGAVVVAGGAWTPELAAALGVDIPVTPLKGQIVHLTLPDTDSSDWTIIQPVLGFYLVPWPDGRVACGGTMEAEAGFDHRPTADGLHQLLHECLRSAPGLAQATLHEVRVGTRPATPDDRPVLGPVPGWSNLQVATGHGAEGLLLGPYSALVVARSVLGGDRSADAGGSGVAGRVLQACSPGRFMP
jgi:D-amino-acid dehydrogenase